MTASRERPVSRRPVLALPVLVVVAVAANVALAHEPAKTGPAEVGRRDASIRAPRQEAHVGGASTHSLAWWRHRARHNRHLYRAEHARYLAEKAHRLRDARTRARTLQAHEPGRPPHYDAWLCLYGYEKNDNPAAGPTGWASNTGNGYYGGLQMDVTFQRTYAPELLAARGTADHWAPLEQMWAAEDAYSSGRGFSPWPTTARLCGLL